MRIVVRATAVAAAVAMGAGGCSQADAPPGAAPTTTSPSSPPATTPTPGGSTPKGEYALTAFASCESFLRHVKREALRVVTPYGLPAVAHMLGLRRGVASIEDTGLVQANKASSGAAGNETVTGATAASAGGGDSAYSGTNVQEEGVDEPDTLKSDGRRLVTLAQGRLTLVDITGAQPRLLGTLDLPDDEGGSELLLAGDRVVVFGHAWERPVVQGSRRPMPSSTVRVVDVADPTQPKVAATLRLEGQYVSARMASGVVRLVVQHDPKGPVLSIPRRSLDEQKLLAEHKEAIRRSEVTDWLPMYTLEQPGRPAVTEPLAPCAAVLRPKEFAGLGTVSVLTVDPAAPAPAAPACVLGSARIVYAGTENLYVAAERWPEPEPEPITQPGIDRPGRMPIDDVTVAPARWRVIDTELHRFAIRGREPAAYVGGGRVDGTVLNQFSMSEHEGRLRVAATKRMADGSTESVVYVLEARDGRLETVGRLGNLGHEGETIHSVRFIGTRGYVVTFRQTDPLYVVDLADPRNPRLRGELQVPGFSSYLHPLSDTVLLGVGQAPSDDGRQGLQLSLFDVADPARPVRTANKVFPGAFSAAQHDHHAFLWWGPTKQLVLPLMEYQDREHFAGAIVMPVDPKAGFGDVDRLAHPRSGRHGEGAVERAMVVGSRLLTTSQAGIMANDLATLDQQGWLAW